MSKIPYRYYLPEDKVPHFYYNMRADMKSQHAPMINTSTMKPATEEELFQVFPEGLVKQEMDCTTKYIPIPEPVREYYKTFRPSPLMRAYNLEKALGTPAKIYFKFEGSNTSGSHKLNSAAEMAYIAKSEGLKGITTETGAGQWGTALSMACAYFGLDLTVYMVKTSYEQKPYRKAVIETFGANIIPSPSNTTEVGRRILEKFPTTGGSLGCAISEAVEAAVTTDRKYVLGSVLNSVLLHQSVIGLEAKAAMDSLGEYPDLVIGCAGGGSNLGGLMAGYMEDRLTGKKSPKFLAVEPASCPSLTRGKYAYDYGDTGKITPLIPMYTLGCEFLPSANHAGGLRYHGMSPIVSKLYHDGYIDKAVSVEQTKVFDAAIIFSKAEGILPAPESSHAIRATIDEALICKQTGEQKTILFGLTGTGYFDMKAYQDYLSGNMKDYIPTDEDLERGFNSLPKVPGYEVN